MIDDGSPITETDFPNAANDLKVALLAHDEGLLRSLGICFPACIYSYDRSTHTAVVMPLVKQAYFNGEWNYLRRRPYEVSVRNIQCGGFTVDIPVYVGDTGWVFSSDRDTLLLKQVGTLTNSVLEGDRPIAIVEDDYQQKPNSPALHTFINGFFIPDNWGPWETNRYKDHPGVSIGSALYIGSSMDTNDNRTDTKDKTYQKGEHYEHKTTSSIVLNHGGGVSLASSSDTDTNQNAHVTVEKNKVEVEASDLAKKYHSSLSVEAEDGIVIRQDVEDNKQHFICSVQPGRFLLRLIDSDKVLNFSFKDGLLNVSTSGGVNMRVGGDTSFRCNGTVNVVGEKEMNVHAEGDVNVRTAKDAFVSTKAAHVVVEEDATVTAKNISATAEEVANVNSGKMVNIGAVEITNINGGQNVNLAAGKNINVTAPDGVNIVTSSNATVMAKKKGANVKIVTLSKDAKISAIAQGTGSEIKVVAENEKSTVNIAVEKDQSSINVLANGVGSSVNVTASGEGADVTVESTKSNVNVKAGKAASISAKKVNISGETRVNGKILVPKVHGKGDEAQYWGYD